MFGACRLLLALVVAVSHFGAASTNRIPEPYHYGLVAVVCFFLLSGYVTAALLRQSSVAVFYSERAMRLWPQFLLALGFAWLTLPISSPMDDAVRCAATPDRALANLLLLPMNYAGVLPSVECFQLVPPAWSLGLEVQFYLLAPLFLALLRARRLVAAGSLAAFVVAALFGQPLGAVIQFLPAVIFIFCAGAAIHDARAGGGWAEAFGYLAAVAAVGSFLALLGHMDARATEIVFGFGLGFLAVAALSALRSPVWDAHLGALSYGVFLFHWPVLRLVELWMLPAWIQPTTHPWVLLVYLAVTCALAWLGYLIAERPLASFRRSLRRVPRNLPASP